MRFYCKCLLSLSPSVSFCLLGACCVRAAGASSSSRCCYSSLLLLLLLLGCVVSLFSYFLLCFVSFITFGCLSYCFLRCIYREQQQLPHSPAATVLQCGGRSYCICFSLSSFIFCCCLIIYLETDTATKQLQQQARSPSLAPAAAAASAAAATLAAAAVAAAAAPASCCSIRSVSFCCLSLCWGRS